MFVAPAFAQESEGTGEGVTHSETGAGHEAGQAPFPPFDTSTFPSQLLWLAITFGLLYVLMKRVIVPRIGGILELRRDRIAQDLDEAARMKEEADAAVAAYEQELADARGKANAIGQEARDKAKAEADAERRKVEEKLDAELGEAEERIASIKETAMKEVGTIAEDTAAAIVQELLGSGVDKKEVAAAVKSARQ